MSKLENLTIDELIKVLTKAHAEADKKLFDVVCYCTDEMPNYSEDFHE